MPRRVTDPSIRPSKFDGNVLKKNTHALFTKVRGEKDQGDEQIAPVLLDVQCDIVQLRISRLIDSGNSKIIGVVTGSGPAGFICFGTAATGQQDHSENNVDKHHRGPYEEGDPGIEGHEISTYWYSESLRHDRCSTEIGESNESAML